MECVKCKQEMMTAKIIGDIYETPVFLSNKKKGLFESRKKSTVSCYVCPNCGYVELYADKPKDLILEE